MIIHYQFIVTTTNDNYNNLTNNNNNNTNNNNPVVSVPMTQASNFVFSTATGKIKTFCCYY